MKGVKAGEYRHPVTFYRNPAKRTDARDELGQIVKGTPEVVAAVWAKVEPLSGNKLLVAQQVQAGVTHTIKCRYFGVELSPDMWVVYNGRTFNIYPPLNMEERDIELVIGAYERVFAKN